MLPKGSSKISSIKTLTPKRLKELPENSPLFSDSFTFEKFTYNTELDSFSSKFEFSDFKQAMCFMNNIALLADQIDHHPEWFNVYNRVEVVLRTHDCDGLSLKDFFLANAMTKVFNLVQEQEREYRDILVENWEKFLD